MSPAHAVQDEEKDIQECERSPASEQQAIDEGEDTLHYVCVEPEQQKAPKQLRAEEKEEEEEEEDEEMGREEEEEESPRKDEEDEAVQDTEEEERRGGARTSGAGVGQ